MKNLDGILMEVDEVLTVGKLRERLSVLPVDAIVTTEHEHYCCGAWLEVCFPATDDEATDDEVTPEDVDGMLQSLRKTRS